MTGLHMPWVGAEIPPSGQLSWEHLGWQEPPVALVAADSIAAFGAVATAKGYLWVPLQAPSLAYRGRLGLFIEEAIENELEARGALPPGIQAVTGLDSSLSDQLYRARLLDLQGIALGVPDLEGIANLGRTLDADDSSVLRWWMAACADRPVRLLVDDRNSRLRVYPAPVLFESILEAAPAPVSPRAPSVAMAESAGSMELSDVPLAELRDAAAHTSVAGTLVAAEALDAALGLTGSALSHSGLSDTDATELGRGLESSPLPPEELQAAVVPMVAIPVLDPDTDVNAPVEARTVVPPAPELEPSAWAAEPQDEEPRVSEILTPAVDAVALREASRQPEPVRWRASPSLTSLDEEEFLRSLDAALSAPPEPNVAAESDAALAAVEHKVAPPVSVEAGNAVEQKPPSSSSSPSHSLSPSLGPSLGHAESAEPESPAPAPVASLTPTPLPTRPLSKNPFIRLVAEGPVAPVVGGAPRAPASPRSQAAEPRDPVTVPERTRAHEAEVSEPVAAKSPAEALHREAAIVPARSGSIEAPRAKEAGAPDRVGPFLELAEREWRNWAKNLEAARGPKPLAVIERLFVTDYTRLSEAVRLGVADETARTTLQAWRESFAQSYSEAFDALRVRGKRPTMVLDLPEMAQRLARLQGARRVQLLLVDGMRFDLGLMIQDRLKAQADAALTERLLLWSALPTCTAYQLELLGRGSEGLKEPGSLEEPPALVARGRAAETPRRVRTGQLELYKLDVVEDELQRAGAPVMERLTEIADRAADAITEFFSKQPPRTLVVVFGDHGFALDRAQAGTTAEVCQGGSTPEEVLVPAFAWLTGAVH